MFDAGVYGLSGLVQLGYGKVGFVVSACHLRACFCLLVRLASVRIVYASFQMIRWFTLAFVLVCGLVFSALFFFVSFFCCYFIILPFCLLFDLFFWLFVLVLVRCWVGTDGSLERTDRRLARGRWGVSALCTFVQRLSFSFFRQLGSGMLRVDGLDREEGNMAHDLRHLMEGGVCMI